VLHPEEAMILQKVGLELPPTLIMLSYTRHGGFRFLTSSWVGFNI
jgi:hypothetical protein